MRFTIDTQEVKDRGVSAEIFLSILPLYFGLNITKKTLEEANKLGFNRKDVNGYSISISGKNLLDSVFMCGEYQTSKTTLEYREIAKLLTGLYPRGFKEGTKLSWRGSIIDVADRLRVIEKKSGLSFSKEEYVYATEEYIDSFEDDITFMQILPYFVFKGHIDRDGDSEWHSTLLDILENRRNNETKH